MPKDSPSTILWMFGMWSILERWKSSINGCLVRWPQIEKFVILKCHLLLFYTIMNHFSIGLWCATSGFYMATQSDWLSGWSKKKLQSTSQSQTCTKKKKKGGGMGHSHCLVVYCWTDPVQLYEFQWNHCNWEVCSANWWDVPKITIPAATISQQKGPSSSLQICPTVHHTTNTWKVEWTGLRSFASFATFTWLISNWLPLI